jgi:hypothetical protein
MEGISICQSDNKIFLNLLSKVVYMGADEDGLTTPAFRAGDVICHIIGTTVTPPPSTTQKKNLEHYVSLARAVKNALVMLVCPIPHHIEGK